MGKLRQREFFSLFLFYLFSDCHCSSWTQRNSTVSKDMTSLSLNYQRECTPPYLPAFIEIKTSNTKLSACTDWMLSEVELDPSKCLYLNDKSGFVDTQCSSVFVKKCIRNDTSTTQSFCQFRTGFNCHCSEWKLKSSSVIGEELFDNYERSCMNPTSEQTLNVTEKKRVLNTTLSQCSSFSDNIVNNKTCVFVDDSVEKTSSHSSQCSGVQMKQCSTNSGRVVVCRNVERACPTCSPWAEIPSPPKFNFNMTAKTQSYQRFCPNGTLFSKIERTVCSPSSFNCSQWVRVNSQENCHHFLNVKPTLSECVYEIEKHVCNSLDHHCQFQHLSVCKYVIDGGVTCPTCKQWVVNKTGTPSEDFSTLNRIWSRACVSGNENRTEHKVESCPLTCNKNWTEYDETKHDQCLLINMGESETTSKGCGLLGRTCYSNYCDLNINYCTEATCKPGTTSQPIGTPVTEGL